MRIKYQSMKGGSLQGTTLAVRVIRSTAELEQERLLWKAWPGHRDSDLDFYLMVLRSRLEVISPYVLVLYRNGLPLSIWIGRLEQTHLTFRIGYLSVCRPNVRLLSLIPWGRRGDESTECSQALIAEVLRLLKDGEFDVANLGFVDAHSILCRLARELPGTLSRDVLPSRSAHWKMDLAGNIDEIYRRFSSDYRGQLRRKAKKLIAEFGENIRVVCLREPSDVERIVEDVELVAKKTYQRGLGVGFSVSDETWNRLRFQAEKFWLRAFILYIEDQPCAFWVGALYDGVFYSDYLGHDPAYDRHSIGTFLTTKAIESLCSEGGKQIDFGPGDSRYKRQFGTSNSEELSIFIFAPSLKGMVLNCGRTIFGCIDWILREGFKRTDIPQRIKKMWRKRATEVGQFVATPK